MKARKKGTNDPFEEIDCLQFKDSYVLYKADMVEFENESKGNEFDVEYWEQLRHQATIAALQGLLTNPNKFGSAEVYADGAIGYADALVAILKKEANEISR